MPRLRRADCSRPGYGRVRSGAGFRYVDTDGAPLADEHALERIRALAIPPAWDDVWICTDELGHLQVLGTDAAGRKQYRYHDGWRARRNKDKFAKMAQLAQVLPDVRARCRADLARPGLPREKALAAAVLLVDRGLFRVGSEQYAAENGTFGIATLRKDHVVLRPPSSVEFDYLAKHAKRHEQRVVDADLFDVVSTLQRRRGGSDELLAWQDGPRGPWHDVTSTDISAYVKQVTGGPFSAKDFRTWHATVLAAVGCALQRQAAELAGGGRPTEAATKRAVAQVVREVAHHLGNTPAVARSSYVDPRVFDRYRAGHTIAPAVEVLQAQDGLDTPQEQLVLEAAVVHLLEGDSRAALERRAERDVRELVALD